MKENNIGNETCASSKVHSYTTLITHITLEKGVNPKPALDQQGGLWHKPSLYVNDNKNKIKLPA